MSLNARKRNSKWDTPEEPQSLRRSAEECSWSEYREAMAYEHKARGWHPEPVDALAYENKTRGWHSEAADADRSRWSSGGRASRRPENFQNHHKVVSRYEEHETYGLRMSPGLDEWRTQNRYHSPKSDWRRTKRSRSRSRSNSRSRSRSPFHGLRRDYEPRSKTKELCRNFAAGSCRRGDQCWFVHQDSEQYNSRIPSRDWCDESSIDGFCEFKRDPASEKPPPRDSTQSSEVLCKFFAAGRCRNNSNCRFSHGRPHTSPTRWSNHEDLCTTHPSNEAETGNSSAKSTAEEKATSKEAGFVKNEMDKAWACDDVEMSPEWNYKPASPPAEKDPINVPSAEVLPIPEIELKTDRSITVDEETSRINHKENSANTAATRNQAAKEIVVEKDVTEEQEKENGDHENDKGDNGKKSKEAKALRAFKFALAEFVKKLMNPKWKEGQMSKEAYKAIVKRAVDKVTHTMQTANVPQTQEKIDHYLTASKPKLTKLLQAYVEKSQKDK